MARKCVLDVLGVVFLNNRPCSRHIKINQLKINVYVFEIWTKPIQQNLDCRFLYRTGFDHILLQLIVSCSRCSVDSLN